jgi:hypothetical protein
VGSMRVIRKTQKRKADDLARLMLALDRLAGESRPWRPRRALTGFVSAR